MALENRTAQALAASAAEISKNQAVKKFNTRAIRTLALNPQVQVESGGPVPGGGGVSDGTRRMCHNTPSVR